MDLSFVCFCFSNILVASLSDLSVLIDKWDFIKLIKKAFLQLRKQLFKWRGSPQSEREFLPPTSEKALSIQNIKITQKEKKVAGKIIQWVIDLLREFLKEKR